METSPRPEPEGPEPEGPEPSPVLSLHTAFQHTAFPRPQVPRKAARASLAPSSFGPQNTKHPGFTCSFKGNQASGAVGGHLRSHRIIKESCVDAVPRGEQERCRQHCPGALHITGYAAVPPHLGTCNHTGPAHVRSQATRASVVIHNNQLFFKSNNTH